MGFLLSSYLAKDLVYKKVLFFQVVVFVLVKRVIDVKRLMCLILMFFILPFFGLGKLKYTLLRIITCVIVKRNTLGCQFMLTLMSLFSILEVLH